MSHHLDQTISKASTLVEALPYLQSFRGKTFLIKSVVGPDFDFEVTGVPKGGQKEEKEHREEK